MESRSGSTGARTVTHESVPAPVLLHVTFIFDPSPRFAASVGWIDFRISFSTAAGVNFDGESVSVTPAEVVAAEVVSDGDEPPQPATMARDANNVAVAASLLVAGGIRA
jgi:hypothetical protein